MDETALPQEEAQPQELSPLEKLMTLAQAQGDISGQFDDTELAKIGADVVADYERDETDREDWKKQVEKALDAAAQEEKGEKSYPWDNAANVKYPMLTVAALQFNARAYPAIVKGDEAVSVKVVGNDNGMPMMGPDGQPAMGVQTPMGMLPVQQMMGQPVIMTPQGGMPLQQGMQPQPMWQRPPGAKASRAGRVRDYMNATLFYRVEGWEEDTDALLLQLPIVGCAFRKVCWQDGQAHISLRPALKIVAPMKARDVESAPRLTEIIDDIFPYEIEDRMASGQYRKVDLPPESDDDQAPRILLEQHRLMDLDDDGVSEPYIVTVDKATSQVLRIESNYSTKEALQPGIRVQRLSTYYVKYDFFPNPKGGFYGIGFGHLLDPITEVVNTSINQLIDAGTAQIAGGGFIAGGVRLQGNSGRVKMQPGEFKTVNGVTGSQLKDAIFERTVPQPSPIAFQLLDMMLAAAKDISSVKDVITGDASNMGQVGTTMALIEQGLQVFTAIYKRVYRSLKCEFTMLFEQMGRWGGEQLAKDYVTVLDDPQANFQADFDGSDFDIRPVSDPTSVTKMQKMARAQFLGGFLGKGLNDLEIIKRMLEAADVEDIDKLMPDQETQAQQAEIAQAGASAEIAKNQSSATKDQASARLTAAQADKAEMEAAFLKGQMAAGLPPVGADKVVVGL